MGYPPAEREGCFLLAGLSIREAYLLHVLKKHIFH